MAFETPTAKRDADPETTFELAITKYGPALYGLALASTGDVADAEDAYQTALEQAWQRWGSLRATASARPWLTKICARTAIRSRRHRLRWFTRHVGMEQVIPGADGDALRGQISENPYAPTKQECRERKSDPYWLSRECFPAYRR